MITIYIGGVIAALGLGLFLAVKAYIGARREISEKDAENAALRKSIKARDRYAEKKEEIRNEAEKKKDSLHTGDNNADFDNSIILLHGAGKEKPSADS
jgi:hypothetical protein